MTTATWMRELQQRWPRWPVDVPAYAASLEDLPADLVLAAIQTIDADGAKDAPSPSLIRRRVSELQVSVAPWTSARATLLLWRRACKQLAAERRQRLEAWVCPDGRCDGSGIVWVDEAANVTSDCSCRPQMRAAAGGVDALPPMLQRFLDDLHTDVRQIDAIADGDTTMEAQVRGRWQEFAAAMVRDDAWAATRAADGVPAIDAARGRALRSGRTGLRVLSDPLRAAGVQRELGA